MTKESTSIRLNKETKDELDKIKVVDCETYDSVINRLIEQSK